MTIASQARSHNYLGKSCYGLGAEQAGPALVADAEKSADHAAGRSKAVDRAAHFILKSNR